MTADRTATEPRTEAGKRLQSELPYAPERWLSAILAIEAEAAQGAGPRPDILAMTNEDELDDFAEWAASDEALSEGAAPRAEPDWSTTDAELAEHEGEWGDLPDRDLWRAAPRAEGHTQDCINAFYSDGGQSGCICGADRCSWTIRCEGETDHSGPHHSKDRFAAPRAEKPGSEAADQIAAATDDDWFAPRAEGLDQLAAALHAEFHGGGHIDTCLRRLDDENAAGRILRRMERAAWDARLSRPSDEREA